MESHETKCDVINVLSYNLHGFNQGKTYLLDTLNKPNCDVVFVQEHWLASNDLYLLNDLSSDFVAYGSSAMDKILNAGILRGRPFGGIAVLLHNKIAKYSHLITKQERFIIVRIARSLLVNVYLPCNDDDLFDDTLACIANAINDQCDFDTVVLGGDFNMEFNNSHRLWNSLNAFLSDVNLVITDDCILDDGLPTYSYFHRALNHMSFIDHFVVSPGLKDSITSLCIIDSGLNFSDHCLVKLTINLQLNSSDPSNLLNESIDNSHRPALYNLRWDKADLNIYYESTRINMNHIMEATGKQSNNEVIFDSENFIERLYQDIVTALQLSASCIPRRKLNFFKYWWDDHLDELKVNSINAHNLWVAFGKPRYGDIFSKMHKAKLEYKKVISEKQIESKNVFSDELNDALSTKDMNSFWKCWNKKMGSSKNNSRVVDGHTSPKEIADVFAQFFGSACSANDANMHDTIRAEFDEIYATYIAGSSDINIDAEDVDLAVNKVKRGKAAGMDGLTIEHILHAHPVVIYCLSYLFNHMLHFGYVPNNFGCGIMIPLLKSTDSDSTKCENYRGLTLSPVISKIFEYVLLQKFEGHLKTSDLQFGFKHGIGTSDALFTLKNTVKHLTRNGCTVNLVALDISKAFDKICHHRLYMKLMERKVPKCFIAILISWYAKCTVIVRWDSMLSNPFHVVAGVRQGGILSPYLFAVYINELIEQLQQSGYGCRMNGQFVGCLLYADDILLLTHSLRCAQQMLDICTLVSISLDLKFNVKKSMALRVGLRFRSHCVPLMVAGQQLQWVSECKYLGIYILAGSTFKCSYIHTKHKFYRCFNALYSKSKFASSEIVCINLLKSYCLPIIMYASDALMPTRRDILTLEKLVNNAVGKIFNTYDKVVISDIRSFCNVEALQCILDRRCKRFINDYRAKPLSFANTVYLSGYYDSISNMC